MLLPKMLSPVLTQFIAFDPLMSALSIIVKQNSLNVGPLLGTRAGFINYNLYMQHQYQ